MSLKTKAVIAVLAFSLVSGLLWAWADARERRARELAIAEEREKQAAELKEANAARDRERQAEREATAKLIQANIELVDQVRRVSAARDAEAAKNRSAVLAPKPIEEAVKDAIERLGIKPRIEPDDRVSITKEELQAFSAMRIDLDRLKERDTEREQQLRLIEDTNARLTKDNAGLLASNAEKDVVIAKQDEVIAAYKKVAKRSRWRKFGSAMGKVGMAVAPAVVAAVILK